MLNFRTLNHSIELNIFGPQIRDSAMGEFYTNLRKLSDQLFFEKTLDICFLPIHLTQTRKMGDREDLVLLWSQICMVAEQSQ